MKGNLCWQMCFLQQFICCLFSLFVYFCVMFLHQYYGKCLFSWLLFCIIFSLCPLRSDGVWGCSEEWSHSDEWWVFNIVTKVQGDDLRPKWGDFKSKHTFYPLCSVQNVKRFSVSSTISYRGTEWRWALPGWEQPWDLWLDLKLIMADPGSVGNAVFQILSIQRLLKMDLVS